MDALVLTFVGIVVGVVVGFVVAWLIRGRELALVARQGDQASSLEAMLRPVRESLEGLRVSAAQAGTQRTAAETEIAAQLRFMQGHYASLESSTRQLAGALARGQSRGQWGEMQLEGLLGHAGLLEGVHYRRQDAREAGRPDISILMPDGGEIHVDAKFPFDAYWQCVGADDPGVRDEYARKHAADVYARARELSTRRYAESVSGADFVVMFLPLESLLSAALEHDGLLLEKSFEKRVVLATPTTMLALLRTISLGYQRNLMAENAQEIQRAGAEMLNRLGILVEHLETMRRGLDQAVRGYNKFVGSFDSQAMRQARRLHDLGVESNRGLESPEPLDVGLRESDARALRG